MKSLVAIILLVAAQLAVAADSPAAQINQRLHPFESLRGSFVEQKQLAGFSKALESHGHFVLNRERGVLWKIEQPLRIEYRFTANSIAQREEGTHIWRSSGAPRGLQRFGPLFLSVLRGDSAALEKDFSLTAEFEGAHWSLTAQPKSGLLQRAFVALRISGGERVERIEIEEKSGDRSVITLSEAADANAALSPEEAKDLAP